MNRSGTLLVLLILWIVVVLEELASAECSHRQLLLNTPSLSLLLELVKYLS